MQSRVVVKELTKNCYLSTFSIASLYWPTYVPILSANVLVNQCDSAPEASGMIDPYPNPAANKSHEIGQKMSK